jgi:dTDP-glucose pyrophosphorylase
MENLIISPDLSVREAIAAVQKGCRKAVFVCDSQQHLLGIFTDGDMRNYILRRGDLDAPVSRAMNAHPFVYCDEDTLRRDMRRVRRIVYPIVDSGGRLTGAVFEGDIEGRTRIHTLSNTPLVIMAGGKGTRLRPYTNILPKALIPIGNVTITERIIEKFTQYGCQRVFMILLEKRNMIRAYFNELEKSYDLRFAEEQIPLGTAGGLQLLTEQLTSSFFVSNCDILINCDYDDIYKQHQNKRSSLTVVCALKNVTTPYGVVELEQDERLREIKEKPTNSFLANTGLYLLEPEVLEFIGEDERIDMTDIIARLINAGRIVHVYPVPGESWLDMGQIDEMETMLKALEEK